MKIAASSYLDHLGSWNPQFLREVKGKLKPKNIIGVVAASLVTQFLIIIYHLGKLPDSTVEMANHFVKPIEQYSRYCIGEIPADYTPRSSSYRFQNPLCVQDLQDHWMINWQVFWWDIFLVLSLMGIGLLLVLGTYFLINNSLAEKKQGTLSLVRLSPQSASSIFFGKILGVPMLLYLAIFAALPLHLVAALQAGINLSLLLAFYGAVIASCAFFYSLGLFISFIFPRSIVSWLTVAALIGFLGLTSVLSTYISQPNTELVVDWLLMFNPNNLLLALGKTTGIPYHYFDPAGFNLYRGSYSPNDLDPFFFSQVLFYGQAIGNKVGIAISLVISNFALWTYWCWQGLIRRYYNPQSSLLTKQQSYWITGLIVAIGLGFSLQDVSHHRHEDNFLISMCLFQFALLIYFIGLIFALSPKRQTLYDWARYRHQKGGRNLWRELVLGENSPSVLAIFLNVGIVSLYLAPSFVLFIDNDNSFSLQAACLTMGVICGTVVFYGAISQLILLHKSKHRTIFVGLTLLACTIGFPIILGFFNFTYSQTQPLFAWLFTPFPFAVFAEGYNTQQIVLGILGQWLAITIVSGQISRNLKIAGRSESYDALKASR